MSVFLLASHGSAAMRKVRNLGKLTFGPKWTFFRFLAHSMATAQDIDEAEEWGLFGDEAVLRIGASEISGQGIFAKQDLLPNTCLMTVMQHVPSQEFVLFCLESGNDCYLALPLILTIACMPKMERDAMLISYASNSVVPADLWIDLVEVIAQHEDIFEKPGVARGKDLEEIAAMVVTNNIGCVIEFVNPVFSAQVGCMGEFSCRINHPPEGQSGNVLIRNTEGFVRTPNRVRFAWATNKPQLPAMLVLPYGIRKGEELVFDYGIQVANVL
jgi:hypothetical protein